jgi:hypothetical protein
LRTCVAHGPVFQYEGGDGWRERYLVLDRHGVLQLYQQLDGVMELVSSLHEAAASVAVVKTPSSPTIALSLRIMSSPSVTWAELSPSTYQQLNEWQSCLTQTMLSHDAEPMETATTKLLAARQIVDRLLSRMQLIELVAGELLLNFMLILILNSSPSHFEAWLFIGSVNILVAWALIVRLEQLVFGPAGEARTSLAHQQRTSSLPLVRTRASAPPSSNVVPAVVVASNPDESSSDDEMLSAVPAPPRGQSPPPSSSSTRRAGNLPASFWTTCKPSSFMVRSGPSYVLNKHHVPSAEPALCILHAVDLFFAEKRIDRIAKQVLLPEVSRGSSLLVLNFQVQKPGLTVLHAQGGPGYSLAMYFELSNVFKSPSASPAVRLARKWLEECDTNEATKERLKVKVNVLNPETCTIPAWALKYNGHGCTLTRSNRVFRGKARCKSGEEVDVLECDVDLREWNLLCRQGVNAIVPVLNTVEFSLALIVQGEADDELPEQVLGAARFSGLDLSAVEKWE